jgi:phosphoenolpyruvate-protein kinase (PTS system EI component)
MSELQATPFVPGIARGVLRRGGAHKASDSIIVVAQHELKRFDPRPAGIVVVEGAPFSHPMITVFGMGIPTIIVSRDMAAMLSEGSEVVIDGARGTIEQSVKAVFTEMPVPPPPAAGKAVTTADGTEVVLRASVSSSEAAARALTYGAAGIGLVRSEFLTPAGGRRPDAIFFERALHELCEAARPLPMIVRLPDIAPDKPVPWLPPLAGMTGPLGLQGARLYGREPVRSVFHAMVDAVARLRDRHEFSLLIPYLASCAEFRHWRDEIAQRLVGPSLPIGAMAETPAAVLEMPNWFDVADFVAIGCNDLMQCLFAADRDLPELSFLLDPCAPSLLRFLRQAAEAAGDNIHKVQLCGLLPQLPGMLPVLVGMGFRVFSIEPVMVPYLAQLTRTISVTQAADLAQRVCAANDSQQVRQQLVPAIPKR